MQKLTMTIQISSKQRAMNVVNAVLSQLSTKETCTYTLETSTREMPINNSEKESTIVETLIRYIESKGFIVQVQPDMLTLYKFMDRHRTAGQFWSITQAEIERTPVEMVCSMADERMHWIERQISQVENL